MRRHFATTVALAVCLALTHAIAAAQGAAAYPAKLVRIIVPFPAAGATDLMTRNVAQKLGEAWNQAVVVENRPGANGMIGADAVAKSQGDGYVLLAATIAHSANVSLFPKATYQFEQDLRPAAILGLLPIVVVVNSSSSIHSLQELVAVSHRQELNAGSGGNGTAAHLTLELFKGISGARIQHVAYKGGAPAMVDLLGGQIDVIFALLPECLPHVRSGKLRALAITTDARHPLLPEVATTAQAGIAGLEVTSWNGLFVASATPADVVAKINAAVNEIIRNPDMKARIIEQGFQPAPMSAGEAQRFVRADVERWAKVIRDANIRAD